MILWCKRSLVGLVVLGLSACKAGEGPTETAPAEPSAVKPAPSHAAPTSSAKPYAGPVGKVAGTVRITGDPSPTFEKGLEKVPRKDCPEAFELYGSLFREGPSRTLADALVTVTEYEGTVEAPSDKVTITAKGCAWSTRTIALALGQHIEVKSLDERGYMPRLVGSSGPAAMVAMPGGKPAEVFVSRPGVHALADVAHPFSMATILVLNYPTFAVTGLDGRFEIANIPAGKAKLTAYLPTISQSVSEPVVIKPGKTTHLDLRLHFDAKEFDALMAKATKPGSAAGAAVGPGSVPQPTPATP